MGRFSVHKIDLDDPLGHIRDNRSMSTLGPTGPFAMTAFSAVVWG